MDGAHRFYYDNSDNLVYEAWAVRGGTATSDSKWKIRKYVWVVGSGNTMIMTKMLLADSNSLYDNILDNRVSLNYG